MSAINKSTGYKGFTVDGGTNYPIDTQGRVKKCIVIVNYTYHSTDVNVSISSGTSDWLAKMGDGSSVPLSNPVILYISRDNAIVQFDMGVPYASNSPLILVYGSDSASITVNSINDIRPFVMNCACGSFAFTTERTSDSFIDGYVNKVVATFQFQNQYADVNFTISNNSSHWAARMGDGSIIKLKNPDIVSVNTNSAVVRFTMDKSYPSNSPCIILYTSPDAYYRAEPTNANRPFVPVTDVIGIPTNGINTIPLDLTCAEIKPYNSTERNIIFTIENNIDAEIHNGILLSNVSGTINLKITVINGKGSNVDFVKRINIPIEKNVIMIDKQPNTDLILYKGAITETLTVFAKCTSRDIHYQWYSNTVNSTSNGTIIDGEIRKEFRIPAVLEPSGNNSEIIKYYYCKISSPGAADVYTNPSKIIVRIRLLGISITNRDDSINVGSTRQLGVTFNPTNAYDASKPVTWSVSNDQILGMNSSGVISGINVGRSSVTVTSSNGLTNTLDVNVVESFVPVTDLTNVPVAINVNSSYNLTPTVSPSNATNKNVIIEILPQTTAVYTFTGGNTITCTKKGYVYIKCTIKNGFYRGIDLIRTFSIRVDDVYTYVPVSDIVLNKPSVGSALPMGELYILEYTTLPETASFKTATFSVISGNATVSAGVLYINGLGNIRLRASIAKGAGNGSGTYTKDFTIPVTSKFVAVQSATFDYVENGIHTDIIRKYSSNKDLTLPLKVNPSDSMPKTYTLTISRVEIGNIGSDRVDDYHVISGWSADNTGVFSIVNNKLHVDTGKIQFNVVYKVYIRIVITNGVAIGTNFSTTAMLSVVGRTGIGYIPVESVNMNFPTHTRTFYPIIPHYAKPVPAYATDINNISGRFKDNNAGVDENYVPIENNFIVTTSQSADDYNNRRVNIDAYIPDGFMLNQSAPPRSIFLWGIPYKYIVPQNPGKFNLTIRAVKCTVTDLMNFNPETPTKIDFVETTEITVKDPYIPIKNIRNIPSSVYAGQDYYLSPELFTGRGMDVDNPYWDDEVPTYTKIELANVSGEPLCTLDEANMVLKIWEAGSVTITLEVKSGKQEKLRWYELNKDDEAISYTQKFNITAYALAEPNFTTISKAYATLYLKNNTSVPILSKMDFDKLCNDHPSDRIITINTPGVVPWPDLAGVSFLKSDVVKVVFGDPKANTSLKIINLKNFCRNFTSLTSIEGLSNLADCDVRSFENFLRGCTSFNQSIDLSKFTFSSTSIKATSNFFKYFLRDCINFNSEIKLPTVARIYNGSPSSLHGFLYGCTKFNQPITLPTQVSGEECMKRFLYGCTKFNQPITLPESVIGFGCMFEFMAECHSFNRNLVMPKTVTSTDMTGGVGRELCNFMKNCHAMCSSVTMYASPGSAAISAQTFSSSMKSSALATRGITIVIPSESKANRFLDRVVNTYDVDIWPYTHYRNID